MPQQWANIRVATRPDPSPGLAESNPLRGSLRLGPGEEATLISLQNYAPGNVFRIISMGVSQHPSCVYRYIVDGIERSLPAPMGSFINPLYTCRDLGFHIDVFSDFAVIIRNNDVDPHSFVGQIIYLQEKTS